MIDWPWLGNLIYLREYDLSVGWEARLRDRLKNCPEFYWSLRSYMFSKGYRGF